MLEVWYVLKMNGCSIIQLGSKWIKYRKSSCKRYLIAWIDDIKHKSTFRYSTYLLLRLMRSLVVEFVAVTAGAEVAISHNKIAEPVTQAPSMNSNEINDMLIALTDFSQRHQCVATDDPDMLSKLWAGFTAPVTMLQWLLWEPKQLKNNCFGLIKSWLEQFFCFLQKYNENLSLTTYPCLHKLEPVRFVCCWVRIAANGWGAPEFYPWSVIANLMVPCWKIETSA